MKIDPCPFCGNTDIEQPDDADDLGILGGAFDETGDSRQGDRSAGILGVGMKPCRQPVAPAGEKDGAGAKATGGTHHGADVGHSRCR